MTDETFAANEGDPSISCPACHAALRLDPSFDAAEFECPACGIELQFDASSTMLTTGIDEAGAPAPIHTLLQDETMAPDTEASDALAIRTAGEERYAIGAELARGGMGAVLNAKDLNLRREVAMKVVLDPKQVRPGQLVRFVHEAQVTGQLEHPSIVPVYELGLDGDGKVYYTMKFIRGTNLGDILKGIREGDAGLRKTYPLPRLLNIFIKACDALAFAHSRDVIHRDLKPDNIMVGDFGEVLIVDWGLAKVLGQKERPVRRSLGEGGDSVTETRSPGDSVESVRDTAGGTGTRTMDGTIMGTPAFMSPEQASGNISGMGPPADVYAMGGILYAILTLEAPVEAKNVDAILKKVIEGDHAPADQHPGEHPHCPEGKIPQALSAVATKAMSLNPEDRYASVQDLQAEVQAYLDGFATSAEGASFWRLAKLFIARHRALFTAGVAAWVLVTAVIAVAFVINLQARRAAETARVEAEQSRKDAEGALQAFRDEQARGRAVRKTAAPALVRAARTLIAQHDLEGAALQVDLARDYDPQYAPAPLLAAQLFIVGEAYDQAAAALEHYETIAPDDTNTVKLVTLCQTAEMLNKTDLQWQFAGVLAAQKQWQLADMLKVDAEQMWQLHQQRIRDAYGKFKPEELQRLDDGRIRLVFQKHRKIPQDIGLKPLKGLPIGELVIPPSGVLNLEPLRGMPLRLLDITGSKVSDLAPLAGMPLEELYASHTDIEDLSPLAGAPLKHLEVAETRVRTIEALRGMPLRHLNLYRSEVQDLAPITGAPLEVLHIPKTRISDLSPVAGAPLRILDCGFTQVADLGPLRGAPLKELHGINLGKLDLSPLAGAPLEVVDLYQTTIRDLSPLRGSRLRKLRISGGQEINDISVLRGMPLENLELPGTSIVDLTPLEGMALNRLILKGSQVSDLTPLRGMPLGFLDCSGSPITDLEPLRGMPLHELRLAGCSQIVDFSVIRSLKQLDNIALPPQSDPLTFIEGHPSLRKIALPPKSNISINYMTVETFKKQQANRQQDPSR